MEKLRIAIDIGGTFTDVALELSNQANRFVTTKTPTTPSNPVKGAMTGIQKILEKSGTQPSQVSSIIHGTTLATNALIEKKGATVGVISTAGFRDILEIAYERRYNQYDINIDKPETLVSRERCATIDERMLANGNLYRPLNESGLDPILKRFDQQGIESVAICLLHAYANPAHELRLAELIAQRRPKLYVSLSSQVSPEAREYDRLSTTIANAYVRPMMERYLLSFSDELTRFGIRSPLFIMTSGGGMTTLETAIRFPIRLVESGPSGGAILAARVAKTLVLDQIVSYDMGGTTAKICLIDAGLPQTSRHFEIARASRFLKGSGLPVRIPVIEMIEIGAGGGSVAKLDRLKRLNVGPESAGSEPGPACFGRGGSEPTVTDSDVILGHIDPTLFAEGFLQIDPNLSQEAIKQKIGDQLAFGPHEAAYAISQIVDENMASAGRVHAVERGKALQTRTMIAFGGNGPLHATRVAEKMGINRIVIPTDPGVGSAIGFLYAPVSYEIVQSFYTTLNEFDLESVNHLLDKMGREAAQIVSSGAQGRALEEKRIAFMRYKGQGHEIEVALPKRSLTLDDLDWLTQAYEKAYRQQFQRSVPGMTIEVMNWALTVSTKVEVNTDSQPELSPSRRDDGSPHRVYFGPKIGELSCPIFNRHDLNAGDLIGGPALIVEDQTTTLVNPTFDCQVDYLGNLILTKREGGLESFN
ncbi:MAG: hydantoinase/oxoprolinase family protein [Chloroflexota bacterium]